jgi:predicted RNase H-like HicB family nuclease
MEGHGEGKTRAEAIADLRDALAGWFEEVGPPEELTLSVDVA